MRKQYHFRPSPAGLLAWDVDRLVKLASALPVERVPLASIRELEEPYWFGDGRAPSVREVAEHARLMAACDFAYPVVLSPDGRVMDGMHRVAKALIEGRSEITAVRLPTMPEPDYVGVSPEDLPY